MNLVFILLLSFSFLKSENIDNAQYLSADRMVTKLWRLPLDRCSTALSEKVFFCLEHKKELVANISYCKKFVYQCRCLHNFFTKLYADPSSNTLVYITRKDFMRDPTSLSDSLKLRRAGKKTLYPIDNYWRSVAKNNEYALFYALYFDCAVRLFVVAVHEAYHTIGSPMYRQHVGTAERCCAELNMIQHKLVGTRYEERYARQLGRYHSLLTLLRKENNA